MKRIDLYEIAQITGKKLKDERNVNALDEGITAAATAGGVDNLDLPLFKQMAANAATHYRQMKNEPLASEITAQRAIDKKKADELAATIAASKAKKATPVEADKTPKAKT